MNSKEQITREIEQMNPSEFEQVYAEFAEEDRQLAEAGMTDYAEALAKEDA